MSALPISQRRSAIVSADLAGFMRLMERDELGTYRRLADAYQEVLLPAVARRAGRLVKASGDGLLLEFQTAEPAVRWSLEVQGTMAGRERGIAAEDQLRFRMAANLAEVIVAQGDIFGNGVNLAARLQQVAAPGEVWITGSAFEQLPNTLAERFSFLGQRRLRHSRLPIAVWRAAPASPGTGRPTRPGAAAAPVSCR